MLTFIAILLLLLKIVDATERCVWISGYVRCTKNPSKQAGVYIWAYDEDGHGLWQTFDKDDLMSVTITDKNGVFHLSGCAKDISWADFIHKNHPDPYLLIKHNCSSDITSNFKIEMPKVFVPDSYDAGLIDLDNERQLLDPNDIEEFERFNISTGSGEEIS